MKKLMTLMLGLTLVFGSVAVFAQEAPKKDDTTTTKKKSGKKGSKKKDETKKEGAQK